MLHMTTIRLQAVPAFRPMGKKIDFRVPRGTLGVRRTYFYTQ